VCMECVCSGKQRQGWEDAGRWTRETCRRYPRRQRWQPWWLYWLSWVFVITAIAAVMGPLVQSCDHFNCAICWLTSALLGCWAANPTQYMWRYVNVIDQLIDWLTDWLIDWLIDWLFCDNLFSQYSLLLCSVQTLAEFMFRLEKD